MRPNRMREFYFRLHQEQIQWIEKCEQGTSYDGPNGPEIRQADQQELRRIEERLREFRAKV